MSVHVDLVGCSVNYTGLKPLNRMTGHGRCKDMWWDRLFVSYSIV
jgi:hypothetical protein